MKKRLACTVLTAFPLLAQAQIRAWSCLNTTSTLEITLKSNGDNKSVYWKALLNQNSEFVLSGTGLWQKEQESEDAFSAFDEVTAISFKNNRAILVLPNGQVVYYPSCTMGDSN